MIIKKFQGKTKEEALENAYRELGPNVVEMNVRNVKKKGLFSFLLPQMVEVTVALEEEPIRQPSSEIVEAIAGVRQVAEKTLIKEENEKAMAEGIGSGVMFSPSKEGLKKLEETPKPQDSVQREVPVRDTGARDSVVRESSVRDTAVRDAVADSQVKKDSSPTAIERLSGRKVDSSVIEEKLDSLHTMLEAQLSKPEEAVKENKESEPQLSDEVSKFVKLLYNTMLDNEINEVYANQIIEEMEKNIKPNTPFEMALSNIYQKMILKFGNPETITPASKGPKVVFFVGPTGVGKTTTIAKIASKFSVDRKKKVALLTADTYRIAAAEQLHTYADILEIPFRVIYATEEVEKALIDLKDYDYILVDTAGHSHHNATQRDVMNGFIHSVDGLAEKEVFLVLSATTKYRDLLSIADTYSSMADYKLIFTKLDETTTLGNLLNLKLHTGAPLSYVTCGQNVPDDIEEFNPQKTVKQLLGGRKD